MKSIENKDLNFPKESFDKLANNYMVVKLKKGKILRQGTLPRSIGLIKSGLISIYKEDFKTGKEISLYKLGAMQTCILSLLAGLRGIEVSVNARAEKDTELILIPIETVREWEMNNTSWNQFIINSLINENSYLIQKIEEISFEKIESRILLHLKSLSESSNKSSINSELEITHQSIADSLGTSRVVVSRILKKLEKSKLLKLARGKIQYVL